MLLTKFLWSLIPHIVYAVLLVLLLKLTRPAYLAFRRRRAGYGVVFNSVTGIPEALASVSLRDLHGQVVRTAVSDKHGRYKLLAPKGEYYVEVKKFGYTFPSVWMKQPEQLVYENVLPSKHVVIKDYGVMTKNIPIDPASGAGTASWLPRLRLSKHMQYAIAFLSPLIALAIPSFQGNSIIAWVLFGLYMVVLFNRMFSFKLASPPFGVVRDAVNGFPLEKAVVRIFDSAYNKLLETQVTSPKGRYAFVINRGAYRIRIECKGYKTVVLNYPHITHDVYVLAKDVRLKRVGEVAA